MTRTLASSYTDYISYCATTKQRIYEVACLKNTFLQREKFLIRTFETRPSDLVLVTGECVRWLLLSMQTHREETDMRTWPRLPRQLPHRCNVIILFQYCAFLKIVNNTRLVKMLPSCCSQIFPISSKYYLSHKKCCLSGELLPLLNNITCPSELFPFPRNICLNHFWMVFFKMSSDLEFFHTNKYISPNVFCCCTETFEIVAAWGI